MLPSHLPRYSAHDRLLCLSNGHGEDVIAVRILQALQDQPQTPKLAALPLVGEGRAYQQLGIPLIGPVKAMPSGGFIYMDGRQFARDVRGGLVQLTFHQFQAIRHWAKQGGSILAVGDIVPLVLAWLSGIPYAFVGTAKSEYYLRDETGRLFPQTFLDGWSGSVYYPWERWLMSRPRCRAIFPRDSITTRILQKWNIPAFDLGNPMMDGLEPKVSQAQMDNAPVPVGRRFTSSTRETSSVLTATSESVLTRSPSQQAILTITLLPGSRSPEAYENWQRILQAVNGIIAMAAPEPVVFLAAITPSLSLESFSYPLRLQGWQPIPAAQLDQAALQAFPDSTAQWFIRDQAVLGLSQHAYGDCLHRGDCAIAMAGTATEQFVGLGKPAITLPGKGPQFTPTFAEAQTRLLGESVCLVADPADVAATLHRLLTDAAALERIAANGRDRMGMPGAAGRIAQCLMQQFQTV
ncbi:MAG: lipid-A-disaccharide synthase-related protein [Leptolyngbyaceae cyanobacterium]